MSQQFDWGSLGEDWWKSSGAAIGADLRQIKFACRVHMGASNAQAAREAGYCLDSPEGARQEGYRVARSNKVLSLLQLAHTETGTGPDGVVDLNERKRILSNLARNSDPLVRIRSIEQLEKIDQREVEAIQSKGDTIDPMATLQELAQMDALTAFMIATKHGVPGFDTDKAKDELRAFAARIESNGEVHAVPAN